MAIASLVLSLTGVLCGVTAIVGFILGLVSLSRIKKSGGALGGRGMAIAGVVVGAVLIAVGIVIGIALALAHNHCLSTNSSFCRGFTGNG